MSPSTLETLPRGQATATVRIVNSGSQTARVRTEIAAPLGWSGDALPQVAEVAPGRSDTVFVSLLVPANAGAASYPVELKLYDAGGAELRRFGFTVQVGRVESVTLVSDWPESASAIAGETITQLVNLVNLGNATESLELNARSSPDWPTTISPAAVSLSSGQSAQVTVSVAVPGNLTEQGDLQLVFVEARRSGTPPDQPALASVVNRTRVVLGSRDASVGPVYATFAGAFTQRVQLSRDGAGYDTRLNLSAPLGPGSVATIEAQTPALGFGGRRYYSDEHFRVAYDDLRRGFVHAGDISVDFDQPLLFYSRSGRGFDVETRSPGTAYRLFYLQDRFGLGLVSAGAQFRRRFDSQVALGIGLAHQLEPHSAFRPFSEQSNLGSATLVHTPDSRNEYRAEVAVSDSDPRGAGQAYRLYGRSADRGFYAQGEAIIASRDFAGAYRDETQARADAGLNLTPDLRVWTSYSFDLENPGWVAGEARRLDETSRSGVDWNPIEDTQLRYSRLHDVRKDNLSAPLGQRRSETSYELAQRWNDFRLVLAADLGTHSELDQNTILDHRRYRISSSLDLPRGSVGLDYYREVNAKQIGDHELREDWYFRTQLHIAKVQDLRADLRYSQSGVFGSNADLTAEWRLGQPERWRLLLNRNFGFSNETALMVEFHQPLRMPFKPIAVGGCIGGRIFRVDDGRGVPNVRLMVDGRSILTDEDGHYSLRGLPPGPHVLDLDFSTLGAGVSTEVEFPQQLHVSAGYGAELDVPVQFSGSVAGTVTQVGTTDIQPSQPVVAVVVELKPLAGGASSLRQTDSLGRFRFGEVAAGGYEVVVRTGSLAEPMTSTPEKVQVSLKPGEQIAGIDFLLKPKPRAIQIQVGE